MSLCVSKHLSMEICREPELLDLLFDSEDGSITFLRNVGEPLPYNGIRQYSRVEGNIERIER
jgi:hypothetical protein